MSRATRKAKLETVLTSGEKWLLNPNTCWQFLLSKQAQDYQNVFLHLAQHAAQKMEKRIVSKSTTLLPPNYLAWYNVMEDEAPKDRVLIPGLQELIHKVCQAQLYLHKFPSVHLFLKWDPLLKMGLKRTDYSEEEILGFLETEKVRSTKQSLDTLSITIAKAREKQDSLKNLMKGCSNLQQMMEFDTAEQQETGGELVDQVDTESRTLSKSLRVALTTATRSLITKGIVTGATEKFLVDIVSNGHFDISNLQPKDIQFLCADAQIIRSRNVKGKNIFQLNDMDN